MKKRSMLMTGMFMLIFVTTVSAWDNVVTHPFLTKRAAESSKLKTYLVNTLKLSDKKDSVLKTELKVGAKPKTILEWLRYGSDQEDVPMCRAANHFHNPLKNWYESGLTDTSIGIHYVICPIFFRQYTPSNINSAISWATGFNTSEKETI